MCYQLHQALYPMILLNPEVISSFLPAFISGYGWPSSSVGKCRPQAIPEGARDRRRLVLPWKRTAHGRTPQCRTAWCAALSPAVSTNHLRGLLVGEVSEEKPVSRKSNVAVWRDAVKDASNYAQVREFYLYNLIWKHE